MLHNQAHEIVHSSAMCYQNLIIIHECSKKLLKMKNSTKKLLTPIVGYTEYVGHFSFIVYLRLRLIWITILK